MGMSRVYELVAQQGIVTLRVLNSAKELGGKTLAL